MFKGYLQQDGTAISGSAMAGSIRGDLGRIDEDTASAHRAQQGPDHSRWPQHRPTDDRSCTGIGRGPGGGGGPDAKAGELPVAYAIQLKPGASASEEELLEHASRRTEARGGAQGWLIEEHAGHRRRDLQSGAAHGRSAGCWRKAGIAEDIRVEVVADERRLPPARSRA